MGDAGLGGCMHMIQFQNTMERKKYIYQSQSPGVKKQSNMSIYNIVQSP